ncbi:hypothetical protein E4T50_13823 [Aureobasidium sp. EXF-12298]|nr:hypothetical protein E4T50_13823 [Aureobasidium sp. EXF-12298]
MFLHSLSSPKPGKSRYHSQIASSDTISDLITSEHPGLGQAISFFDFKPLDIRGHHYDLSIHKGKVIVVINTASNCACASQINQLVALYSGMSIQSTFAEKDQHADAIEFIAFPCDQFGNSEPESDGAIQQSYAVNYGVEFPVLGKIHVNDEQTAPVYQWMKEEMPGFMCSERIKWNFEKFLIGRDGRVLRRFASEVTPELLKPAILKALSNTKSNLQWSTGT